jgi:hypothetical protein
MADNTTQSPNPPTSNKQTVFDRMGKFVSKVPKAAASFVVGSVGGIPISVVRHSASEMKLAAKEMGHGIKDPLTAPFYLILGPEAFVLGSMSGVVVGPYDAIETSAVNCWNKPFSKESFSLGAMEKVDDQPNESSK